MTVNDLCERLELKPIAGLKGMGKEIKGAYVCDLLSWVMAHAEKANVWLTIQAHANIVAVASLLDLSCIVIVEGVEVDSDTIEKADQEGIPILTTGEDAYTICCKLNGLGI